MLWCREEISRHHIAKRVSPTDRWQHPNTVHAASWATARSLRTQVVQQCLLIAYAEHIEVLDYFIGFRTTAGVLLNSDLQVGRAAVMEKEDTLADAPERRGAELISRCSALSNSIGESRSHIVQGKVAQRMERDVGCGRTNLGVSCGLVRRVAGCASDIGKDLLTASYRSSRTGRTRGRRRSRGGPR